LSYDVNEIIKQGNSFIVAAKRCLELRPIDANRFELPIAPAIVCGVFAIELYFKAIITVENGFIKGHDLSLLFSHLSPTSQAIIRNELSLDEIEFKNQLDIVSNAFVEWRYIFEKSHSSLVKTEFIIGLATVSKKLAGNLTST
jgi:hypothetical protein